MNSIIGFIVGAGVGAVGTYLMKNHDTKQANTSRVELESIYSENEKLRHRNKEVERQNEDLLSELDKCRCKMKSNGENHEDLQDDLEDALLKVKKLTAENAEMRRKLSEYQTACASLENEIKTLKNN